MIEQIIATDGAILSADRQYRYRLHRFGTSAVAAVARRKYVNFIMLNPSTADEVKDDPTVNKVRLYAQRWGYPWLVITNLFAFRTALPDELLKAEYPISPPEYPKSNDEYIIQAAMSADKVVTAWGTHGSWQDRDLHVLEMLYDRGIVPYALGFNQDGTPVHPLHQPKDVTLVPYVETK